MRIIDTKCRTDKIKVDENRILYFTPMSYCLLGYGSSIRVCTHVCR